MAANTFDLLTFEGHCVERIWGGQKLRTIYGKEIPQGPIGEEWAISDHRSHESRVATGPHAGRSLRELLEQDAPAILGTRAQLTVHGRFPLLLKILDAKDRLSVQVHPDDDVAARLGEPDVGKTEMWHVLRADPGSELICGLAATVTPEVFERAVRDGSVEGLMTRFPVTEGTSVFVPARTVHAIGEGIVLAEIQQNSDLTYRIYDWGRLQDDGTARELHVEKSLEAVNFGSGFGGLAEPLGYEAGDASCTVLAACRYFAAELIGFNGRFVRDTRNESFHILLAKSGALTVSSERESRLLNPGYAALVPGCLSRFTVEGVGELLDYYVPDLRRDIAAPLSEHGHAMGDIVRLGGSTDTSDLRGL